MVPDFRLRKVDKSTNNLSKEQVSAPRWGTWGLKATSGLLSPLVWPSVACGGGRPTPVFYQQTDSFFVMRQNNPGSCTTVDQPFKKCNNTVGRAT